MKQLNGLKKIGTLVFFLIFRCYRGVDEVRYNAQAQTESLYIHWPFCPYKCHYCPFVAIAGHDQFMHDYHKSLMAEIETFAREVPQKLSLDTI